MKHILLVARGRIPSVLLCGDAQLSLLAEEGKLEYRRLSPLRVKSADLLWADVLVFVRADDDVSLRMAELARAAGKECFYVLDDDLLSVPEGFASSEHYTREETRALIRANMAACSVLLSPSEQLLEKYGAGFEKCLRIEEPATAVIDEKHPESGCIRIGFAGSIDRAGDLDTIVSGALRRILREYGGKISVEIFGAKPALCDELSLRHIPYCDSYEDYSRTMRELNWDIALAPMPDTEFHRGKHYNKYIEYASYGIAGIYSDVAVYRRAVRNGENGLLCENTEEAWYGALRRLIEDAALRESIAAEALREAKERYSLPAVTEAWETLLAETETHSAPTEELRHYDRERLLTAWRWVLRKLRAWGWRAPVKLWERIKRSLRK